MRSIPLYTLEGVQDAEVRPYSFSTEDGLGLSMLRFSRGTDPGESVLVIHGLTTSSDMFIMPEHRNLVTHLLDSGYRDVWCLDFRMSNRYSYNLFKHRYTMDDVALFDFPPAVELVRRENGGRPIHVICHCLGSVSFMMSLFGGAVDGIASVIANSVALTPRVPGWSRLKLGFAPFLASPGASCSPRSSRASTVSATSPTATCSASCGAPAGRRCTATRSSPRSRTGAAATSTGRRA